MAEMELKNGALVDSEEALAAKMAVMKEAQQKFAQYSQEQVDAIFKAAATAADKARIPLCEDGGRGDRHGYCGRQGD